MEKGLETKRDAWKNRENTEGGGEEKRDPKSERRDRAGMKKHTELARRREYGDEAIWKKRERWEIRRDGKNGRRDRMVEKKNQWGKARARDA